MSIRKELAKLQRLQEAIGLAQAMKYRKEWNPNTYANIFQRVPQAQRDRKGFRIYLPYGEEHTPLISAPYVITDYLKDKGYIVTDYAAGMAKQMTGKREMKIGKLLADNPDLLQKFVNDPKRSAKKIAGKLVCISRHPLDIAGMSTDRGWTSCMELGTGSNQRYVMGDVKAGTIIAYLIRSDDLNIERPISRLLIKPFINNSDSSDILLATDAKQYGADDHRFGEIVEQWLEEVNGPDKKGMYCLHSDLYSDGKRVVVAGSGDPGTTPEENFRFIENYLDAADLSPPMLELSEDGNITIGTWDSLENFCRSNGDDMVEYLLNMLENLGDLDSSRFSDPSVIREILALLPDDAMAVLCKRHGVRRAPSNSNDFSVMLDTLANQQDVATEIEDAVANPEELKERLRSRIDEYVEAGWYFAMSQCWLEVPEDGDHYDLAGEVKQVIGLRGMLAYVRNHADDPNDEQGDGDNDLWKIEGGKAWDDMDDNHSTSEWRGEYANNTLVDRRGDDLIFGSEQRPKIDFDGDSDDDYASTAAAYTRFLRGETSTRIESPDQPDMFESDMRRLINRIS